jgi:YtfJ family uncharacterized protein
MSLSLMTPTHSQEERMRSVFSIVVLVSLCFFTANAMADLKIGEVPKTVTLKDELGGRLDGSPWSSTELTGKVSVVFYVDPDEKDLNNPASEALKAEGFSLEKYQSYGIINMAATWLPNFAISSSLEKKQKIYTNTIYVRDYKKALVKEWGIADDNSDILAFDKAGKLIFKKEGLLNDKEIQMLIQVIRDHLDK